ncbi:rRNA processing protein RRP15 [Aspergillus sclerotialis]|uniref:rRNA processing protein RRP15 n=1 Tax=Aspergillus sclerotialis TaxID=2070753 RepID=A0A3A2ZYZ4_9EURO|nr:rRNA processing protein RRP15 [Aspergillus sclerotialis]
MAPTSMPKKRKVLDGLSHPKKKFKKQREYHSSSDEAEEDEETGDFTAVNLADSDEEEGSSKEQTDLKSQKKNKSQNKNTKSRELQKTQSAHKDANSSHSDNDEVDEDASGSEASSGLEEDSDSDASISAPNPNQRSVPKRNDPSAFSTSISKILSTKLPTSARADPVLSRSKAAVQSGTQFEDEKLDKQARAKLRAEKKEELDRGRIRDVMGIERGMTGAVAEEEKRLRKIGQRGVVKLFNAVRAAQVRGEEAAKAERQKGTIGMGEREKNINEVSKQGFLELISGKKGKPLNIEEA